MKLSELKNDGLTIGEILRVVAREYPRIFLAYTAFFLASRWLPVVRSWIYWPGVHVLVLGAGVVIAISSDSRKALVGSLKKIWTVSDRWTVLRLFTIVAFFLLAAWGEATVVDIFALTLASISVVYTKMSVQRLYLLGIASLGLCSVFGLLSLDNLQEEAAIIAFYLILIAVVRSIKDGVTGADRLSTPANMGENVRS